jgi:hypothetical protein
VVFCSWPGITRNFPSSLKNSPSSWTVFSRICVMSFTTLVSTKSSPNFLLDSSMRTGSTSRHLFGFSWSMLWSVKDTKWNPLERYQSKTSSGNVSPSLQREWQWSSPLNHCWAWRGAVHNAIPSKSPNAKMNDCFIVFVFLWECVEKFPICFMVAGNRCRGNLFLGDCKVVFNS